MPSTFRHGVRQGSIPPSLCDVSRACLQLRRSGTIARDCGRTDSDSCRARDASIARRSTHQLANCVHLRERRPPLNAAVGFFSPQMVHRPDVRPVASFRSYSHRRLRAEASSDYLRGNADLLGHRRSVRDAEASHAGIRYLLAQAGGSASDVPDDWNGTTLDVRLGPIVIADYDGTLLLQRRPFRLIAPAGFDLALFYRIAFRSMGIGEQQAAAPSNDMGFSPHYSRSCRKKTGACCGNSTRTEESG